MYLYMLLLNMAEALLVISQVKTNACKILSNVKYHLLDLRFAELNAHDVEIVL